MTTYYVRKTGNDSTGNGLSPATAWQTGGKALGASGIASGDTVVFGGGTYREIVTVAMTSATSTTNVIGDVDGSLTGDPGEVIFTAYTTNDWTAPSASAPMILNGRDYLHFQKITFIAGTGRALDSLTSNSIETKFTNCAFFGGAASANLIDIVGIADVAMNWIFDSCVINASQIGIQFTLATSASADYDVNVLIKNCLITGTSFGVSITASGAGAFKAGGVDIQHCFFHNNTCIRTNSANISTSIPCTVVNCFLNGSTGISANTSGQFTETQNRFNCNTPRSNVSTGTNSSSGAQPLAMFHFGQEAIYGFQTRPFGTPVAASNSLGFGDSSGLGFATDIFGITRPAGGGNTTTTAETTGTATAGAGSTLTDSGASWTTNAFAGYKVKITGGTGSGQQRVIASNTGTVLTTSTTWGTNPDNTSQYSIYHPAIDPAAGAFERPNTALQETSTVDASGSGGKILGPGSQDIRIPVDASSTSISVKMRYNSDHGTTNKPQAILLANGQIGVSTETKTMTSGADTWETLTFSSFTPSAKGWVTIRLRSRAEKGFGICHFDTFSGGAQGTQGIDYFKQLEPLDVAAAAGTGGAGIARLVGGGLVH